MAIDTAAKRLSCLDFEEVWAEALPIPDGTIAAADRQHALWSYAGISMLVLPDIPGCATISVYAWHTAEVTAGLLYAAEVSAGMIGAAMISVQQCAAWEPVSWAPAFSIEAWVMPGVLLGVYETATGLATDTTFGSYAMLAVGNTVYIGLGTWPGGPLDSGLIVSTEDGITFTVERVVDEQGVHDLSVRDGVVWVPGTDPTDDWTLGNLYRRAVSGTWAKIRTLTNVIHSLGLWHDENYLYVGVGAHAGDNITWLGQVFRSADEGLTWDAPVTVGDYRVYDVIGWQGKLYAMLYQANASTQVQVSTDSGLTWSLVAGVTPKQNPRLTIWGNYLVGVTTAGGLFTIDQAGSVALITPSFTVNSSLFNPLATDGTYLYVLDTAASAVYRTANLVTWTLVASVANVLSIATMAGYLLIATSDAQIFRVEI